MASLYTEIEINAPKAIVWQVLITKNKWKYWNTFLFDCDPLQPLELGNDVFLSRRRLLGDEETEFQAKVTFMKPGVCLKWESSFPGLRYQSVFELQEIGVKRTKYIHKDNFSGFWQRVLLPFIREDELQGMRRMARELKRYSEVNF